MPDGYDEVGFSNYMADLIDQMFSHTDIRVPRSAVDIAHRLYTKKFSETSAVVIVKFNQKSLKRKIWRCAEMRLDKSISITQHLTSTNLTIFKGTRKAVGEENVWCSKGKVFASVNGKVRTVRSCKDIPKPVPPRAKVRSNTARPSAQRFSQPHKHSHRNNNYSARHRTIYRNRTFHASSHVPHPQFSTEGQWPAHMNPNDNFMIDYNVPFNNIDSNFQSNRNWRPRPNQGVG